MVKITLFLLFSFVGMILSAQQITDEKKNAIALLGGVMTNHGYNVGIDYERSFESNDKSVLAMGIAVEYLNQRSYAIEDRHIRSQAVLFIPQYRYRYWLLSRLSIGAGLGFSLGFSDSYVGGDRGKIQVEMEGIQFTGGALLSFNTEYVIGSRISCLLSIREYYSGNATLDSWLLSAMIGVRFFF